MMKVVAAVKEVMNSGLNCLYVTFHLVVYMDSVST